MDDFQNTSNSPQQTQTTTVAAKPENPSAVSKPVLIFAAIVGVLIAGILVYSMFFQNKDLDTLPENSPDGITPTSTEVTEQNLNTENDSNYIDYSASSLENSVGKRVVLFFTAEWCISCRELDVDIRNNLEKIPADLLILKVNYDSSSDLKSTYNIDKPNTLILLGSEQSELKRWADSMTLDKITRQL